MDQLLDFLLKFSGPVPYFLVFSILMACGLGLPIPEDITLVAAGVLAYYGNADVWVMIVVSFLGVLIGDSFIFYIGHKYGRRATNFRFFRNFLTPQRLQAMSLKLRKRGNKLIFAARFMPGFRAPIFFTAGTLHLPYRIFLFYDGLAALISVPTIIYLTYYFGHEVDHVVKTIKKVQNGILFVIIGLILLALLKWYFSRAKSRT